MTSNERRAVRAALIVLGFIRVGYTEDIMAVGDYQEVWSKGENQVTIAWGARTMDDDPGDDQTDDRGTARDIEPVTVLLGGRLHLYRWRDGATGRRRFKTKRVSR